MAVILRYFIGYSGDAEVEGRRVCSCWQRC